MRSNWSPELLKQIEVLYVDAKLSAGAIARHLQLEGFEIKHHHVRHVILKMNLTRTQSDAAALRIKRQNGKWFEHYKPKDCFHCREQFEPTSRNQIYCHKCNRRGLLSSYGITAEDYDLLINKQRGECPICHTSLHKLTSKQIHLDHDHHTGIIRGIICHMCNWRLSDSDAEWFTSALQYVSKPGVVPRIVGAVMNSGKVSNLRSGK